MNTIQDTDREALDRLRKSADFAVYQRHLQGKLQAAQQLFPPLVDSQEAAALYNKQRGFIEGLAIALQLCDMLINQRS